MQRQFLHIWKNDQTLFTITCSKHKADKTLTKRQSAFLELLKIWMPELVAVKWSLARSSPECLSISVSPSEGPREAFQPWQVGVQSLQGGPSTVLLLKRAGGAHSHRYSRTKVILLETNRCILRDQGATKELCAKGLPCSSVGKWPDGF